jgi:hypothetical protein
MFKVWEAADNCDELNSRESWPEIFPLRRNLWIWWLVR